MLILKRLIGAGLIGVIVVLSGCAGIGLRRQTEPREVDVVGHFEDALPERLAIEVAGDLQGDRVKDQIEELFTMELLRQGYRLIDKGVTAGMSNPVPPARIHLVIRLSGNRISSLTGRIVDTETADILLMARLSGDADIMLSQESLGGELHYLSVETEENLRDEIRRFVGGLPPPLGRRS